MGVTLTAHVEQESRLVVPAVGIGAPAGPVAVSAAVARSGRLDVGWAGDRDPEARPVVRETRFQVASLSKPVTALVVLRLVQAGTLSLDDDVNEHLRACRVVTRSGTPVTIRQMLTHTAGLGIVRGRRDLLLPWVTYGERRAEARSPRELYGSRLRTLAEPEATWCYGSHGAGVVQQVVEDVTGGSYADAARAEVFDPLGLADSAFAPRAPGGRPFARGCCRRGRRLRWRGTRVFSPVAGGGLWTTASDLARLGAAVLDPVAGDWLEPGLRDELLKPQPFRGGTHPYMGLGIRLGMHAGEPFGWHGGRWWGSYAWLVLRPADQLVAVVLSTGAPAGFLLDRLAPARRPPPRVERPFDAALAGTYRASTRWLGAPTAHLAFGAELRIVARPHGLRLYSAWGAFRHGVALRPVGGGRYAFWLGAERHELAFTTTTCGTTVFLATPMCCFQRIDDRGRRHRWRRVLVRGVNAVCDALAWWRAHRAARRSRPPSAVRGAARTEERTR